MSIPSSPNYNKTNGRLVVDRFDFEDHIEGHSFRHKASTIDLAAPTTINSVVTNNLQQAIDQIVILTFPPVIPDATSSVKGLIKLNGDLAGTASSVIVSGLQNRPVSSVSPTAGDILTWDGGASLWKPAAPTNVFSAGGDLAGSSSVQTVSSLTGSSGIVNVIADIVQFRNGVNPQIIQDAATTGNGASLSIKAQSTTDVAGNGGDVVIRSGAGPVGNGGIKLQINSNTLTQLNEPISGSRVFSLFNLTDLTTSQMPSGTGDKVMYVADTSTPPTSGNPVNGTIVYSNSGQLFIKQSNGDNFSVGSMSNPSIWGPIDQQLYTYRTSVTSVTTTPTDALVYALPDLTAVYVDVTVTGKRIGSNASANYKLSMGYVRDSGGSPQAIGSVTTTDTRALGLAGSWGVPTISVSGNNLKVTSGSASSGTINWFFVIKLYLSKA